MEIGHPLSFPFLYLHTHFHSHCSKSGLPAFCHSSPITAAQAPSASARQKGIVCSLSLLKLRLKLKLFPLIAHHSSLCGLGVRIRQETRVANYLFLLNLNLNLNLAFYSNFSPFSAEALSGGRGARGRRGHRSAR